MFVVGLGYSMMTGRTDEVSSVLLSSPKDGFLVIFEMGAILVFWSGILEICKRSGLLNFITKGLIWIIHPLFKKLPKDGDAMKYIALNLTCNAFGVGSAATPFGLKAFKELDEINEHSNRASNEMIMFLTINTSGFCLIPSNVIAMREAFHSTNSSVVIPYVIIISLLTTFFAITLNKVLGKRDHA